MSDAAAPAVHSTADASAPHPTTTTTASDAASSATANVQSGLQTAKDTVVNSKLMHAPISVGNADNAAAASSTLSTVQNHPTVQSISNGPVAESAKKEAVKTQTEFQNLANARTTPATPAATGQPLTHYHSLFYNLLSWENPRASGIAFVSTILFILAARYLDILHYIFKLTYITLGTTALLEVVGKTVLGSGLASHFRPRKYYTIPRESLERSLEDVEQLINFFVIEVQRIIFAENVLATVVAFMAALVGFGLIKIVPFWGLCLIATSVLYSVPLIYVTNKKVIDDAVDQTSTIVNQQTSQLRDLTAQHTSKAAEAAKSYAGEYSALAQDYMGMKKPQEHTLKPSAVAGTAQPQDLPQPPTVSPMPNAPSTEPKHDEKEPLISH